MGVALLLNVVLWTLLVLTACDTAGVRFIDPPVEDEPERTVTITVRLEDSALAAALGWGEGVPGALISYYRILGESDILTAETDSTGKVRLGGILRGQYRIAAYRALENDETGPTDGRIRAFGDGLTVWVSPPQDVELALRGDEAGSLVLSEIRGGGRYGGPGSEWPDYDWFGYFEIYNNSDTTVYMDGMLWGHGFLITRDGVNSCETTEPFRDDPLGVWTWFFHQFPGGGSDYPLTAGQTAIVALDAVDHSVVHPDLPDLTSADFELEGQADADNPDVPNMPEVGPVQLPSYLHGVGISCAHGCFLALAADPESLLRQRPHFLSGGHDWVRIPMASILDVVTTGIWEPSYDQLVPCSTKVQRRLDRLEKPLHDVYYDVTIAMQRRVLRIGASGYPVLQDVGVSFSDFEIAPRSPGWVRY